MTLKWQRLSDFFSLILIMVQILPHTIAITLALLINAAADPDSITLHNVKVFYYLLPDWGESLAGTQSCPNKNMSCHWEYSGNITQLVESFDSQMSLKNASNQSITVTMYNIHSLWHKLKKFYPMNCSLKTDLSIACSEESSKHPSHSILFPKSFPNFDGYSTTHPSSSVQKIYKEAYLNQTTLDFHTANSMKSFPQLIKAGTYIASACHNKHGAESTRDKIVKALRAAGFRIDGLGNNKKTIVIMFCSLHFCVNVFIQFISLGLIFVVIMIVAMFTVPMTISLYFVFSFSHFRFKMNNIHRWMFKITIP